MTIISTTVGRNPQKKWSTHHSQQNSPKYSLGFSLKNDRMISVRFQGKPFNITLIQVYVLTSNTEEAERFNDDLQETSRTNTKKKMSFSL